MKQWNVYIDGKYFGTVSEDSEEHARAAAYSKFDAYITDNSEVSVNPR